MAAVLELLMDKRPGAKALTEKLAQVEGSVDSAILDATKLVEEMLEADRLAGPGPRFSGAGPSKLASAIQSLIAARDALSDSAPGLEDIDRQRQRVNAATSGEDQATGAASQTQTDGASIVDFSKYARDADRG